jgi:hypothetical protein
VTTDEIIKKLEPWLTKHRRPAWKPVVEDGDGLQRRRSFPGRRGLVLMPRGLNADSARTGCYCFCN